MGVARKLRVLCMHGYRTNAKIMEDQARGLRKALVPHAEFVFLNGPIEARGPSDDVIEKLYAEHKSFYEWGSFTEHERPLGLDPESQEIEYLDGGWYHDYVDWDTTVKYMDEQLPKLGPVDAVVGFSTRRADNDGADDVVSAPPQQALVELLHERVWSACAWSCATSTVREFEWD